MNFDDILEQVIALLKSQGRVSYGAIKRRFELDDGYLEDLKGEILYVHESAVEADDRGFTWRDKTEDTPVTTSQPNPSEPQFVAEQPQSTPVEPSPVEPHAPDAERRQLTVMFCDLVGSTHLSVQLDPEDLREIVRSYQAACTEVIQRYDGHVAQHLGDGLLVYFGYPQAHEDDPQRAVHTGLGIIKSLKTLNARLETDRGIQLSVRVGIHTGLVVVGEIGSGSRQEQLALGETPNVAARIQGIAEPDTVVISADTHRLIQGYFECESLGEHDLRGVSEPMAVYRALQESGAQSRLDIASPRGLTPLIGRDSESTLLFERWTQAKDGQGQVVLLSGEAGIGKSRLVQALKNHVADEPHTRLECRSSTYFSNSALYPIIDMVQRTLQFQADDTPDKKLNKLEQALAQYRLPTEETVPLMAGLLSLSLPEDKYPPLNLTPQRQRQKTLETIVAMLLELAERQPILFIVEDLHWMDPSTLELLDLLVEQTPTASIYTLLTCRPEFQAQWTNRSYFTQITLNRLSRDDIEQMVERVTEGKPLPNEIVQQLVDKTDGVPLYVEEMTKAVLESGVIKEVDGQYELTGPVSSLSIPTTLQDSLMARLDRLVTAKAVAQYASVIGRQFSYELLQAVSELNQATLQRELGRLVDAELVYQRGVVPGATYIFKNALVQDTAYESLLRSTRQGYHRRIAEVLAKQIPEMVNAQPELVAHHFTEAGLNEQAVDYWYQAGQRASQRSANVEVIAHLNKGLEVLLGLADPGKYMRHELQIQALLGPALLATKGQGSSEVEATYKRAYALCQQMPEAPQLFPVLRGLWNFYLVRGDLTIAHELGERLCSLATHQHDPVALLWGHLVRGLGLFYRGTFTLAYEQFAQSITLYDAEQHRAQASLYSLNPLVACQAFAAYALWFLGYPERAKQQEQEVMTQVQDGSHAFSLASALNFTSRLYHYRRDIQATEQRAQTLMTLSSEHGFPTWLAQGQIQHGWALTFQDQEAEGVPQLREGLAAWRASGANLWLSYNLALLAEAYYHTDKAEEGLKVLGEALALVAHHGERFYEAELHRLKGQILLQQSPDNAPEAETCFQKAITIAQSQQAKSLELRSATSLAKLWQSQGKHKEAYDLLAPVYGWFTEGFNTADLKDAKALLDELSEVR